MAKGRVEEAKRMSEEKIVSVIRDFAEAAVKQDVEKRLSLLTEDVVFVYPEGTFKGKEEVKRLLTWQAQLGRINVRDAGVGIMAKGNKAVYEHIVEGQFRETGIRYEAPTIPIFEFSGEKIQQAKWLYDRLTVAKQVANGWFERKVIDLIVNRAEKGLHYINTDTYSKKVWVWD